VRKTDGKYGTVNETGWGSQPSNNRNKGLLTQSATKPPAHIIFGNNL